MEYHYITSSIEESLNLSGFCQMYFDNTNADGHAKNPYSMSINSYIVREHEGICSEHEGTITILARDCVMRAKDNL